MGASFVSTPIHVNGPRHVVSLKPVGVCLARLVVKAASLSQNSIPPKKAAPIEGRHFIIRQNYPMLGLSTF